MAKEEFMDASPILVELRLGLWKRCLGIKGKTLRVCLVTFENWRIFQNFGKNKRKQKMCSINSLSKGMKW